MTDDARARLEQTKEALRVAREAHETAIRKVLDLEEAEKVCSRPGCGLHHWDDGAPLTPFTVTVLPGEEGYSEVTQILCQEHNIEVAEALIALGFGSHNHHGTCTLDANAFGTACGGYGKCPHPAEYGPEIVLPETSTYRGPQL